MALVIKSAPQQAANLVLKEALARFRAVLPADRQKELDEDVKRQSLSSSAMQLTGRIDQATSGKLSKKLGPRLLPFLECVKTFAGIVDTFVTSDPTIAALVWGSIKVFFLFICNAAEYFEKLTDVFRSIGDTMPGLKDFELLFESSTGLQTALACYYAVVIDICRQAVLALQRSTINQLAHSAFKSFTSEYSSLQTDLQRNLTKIHEQISLASKQIIVDESRKNELERIESSSFRSSWAKSNAKAAQTLEDLRRMQLQSQRRHLRQDRETVRSRLSTIDPNTSWQRIKRECVPGTASWFENDQDFIDWRSSQTSSTLIHSARMGCGKTIVFSNIIDSLVISEGSNAMISFFFMEGENAASLKPRNIIGSILKQLLEPTIQSADLDMLEELLTKSALQDPLNLVSALQPYISNPRPAFVLLDGIDETEANDLTTLLGALGRLWRPPATTTIVRMFITCRPSVVESFTSLGDRQWISPERLVAEQLPQSMRGATGRLGAITAHSRRKLASFRRLPAADLTKHYGEMHRRLIALSSDSDACISSHLIDYAGAYWIHHGADLEPERTTELCKKFRHLAQSSGPHVKKPWLDGTALNCLISGISPNLGKRSICGLEASAQPERVHVVSEVFNSHYFEKTTLLALQWSFSNNNMALLYAMPLTALTSVVSPTPDFRLHTVDTLNTLTNLFERHPRGREASLVNGWFDTLQFGTSLYDVCAHYGSLIWNIRVIKVDLDWAVTSERHLDEQGASHLRRWPVQPWPQGLSERLERDALGFGTYQRKIFLVTLAAIYGHKDICISWLSQQRKLKPSIVQLIFAAMAYRLEILEDVTAMDQALKIIITSSPKGPEVAGVVFQTALEYGAITVTEAISKIWIDLILAERVFPGLLYRFQIEAMSFIKRSDVSLQTIPVEGFEAWTKITKETRRASITFKDRPVDSWDVLEKLKVLIPKYSKWIKSYEKSVSYPQPFTSTEQRQLAAATEQDLALQDMYRLFSGLLFKRDMDFKIVQATRPRFGM